MCWIRLKFNQLPGQREEPQKLSWVWEGGKGRKHGRPLAMDGGGEGEVAILILVLSYQRLGETKQV